MIRCGIIGCGVIAPTHIEAYQSLPDVEVVHLSDIIPERMKEKAEKYHIPKCSADYRTLLADPEVDLVSICTDHASHAQIFIDALNAGKHVICEKSFGRVQEDLERMTAAAHAHPELVSSGIFQHRFEQHNLDLKQLVQEAAFGKIVMINLHFRCRRTEQYYQNDPWRGTLAGEGGGILINQAIHHLDQLRFIFGEITQVSAHCSNMTHQGVIEVEDTAVFTARFAAGFSGVIAATNASVEDWCSTLLIDGSEVSLNYVNEKCAAIHALDTAKSDRISALLGDSREGISTAGKSYYGSGHTAQLAEFISAIREKRPSVITAADAANSSSLVLAVYASAAQNGTPVEVKLYK